MNVYAAIINSASVEVPQPFVHYDDLLIRFWNALKDLTVSDMLYLSRTIGSSYDTIHSWKYRNQRPRDFYCIIATIRWVEDGKPVERINDSVIY